MASGGRQRRSMASMAKGATKISMAWKRHKRQISRGIIGMKKSSARKRRVKMKSAAARKISQNGGGMKAA